MEDAQVEPVDAIRAIFHPRSVAVVGASSDPVKFSGQPLGNLLRCGYTGQVYAVNPRGAPMEGVETVPDVEHLPAGLDLAIVLLPAGKVGTALEGLGRRGTTAAIVAVSGFAETGDEAGDELQQQIGEIARAFDMRVVGPNCNGIYNVHDRVSVGYNVVHSRVLRPGGVGLISHSGAMVSSLVSLVEHQYPSGGLSHFVSTGNEADLTLNDFLFHLVEDPSTTVIAAIVDSVGDGTGFRRAARAARRRDKPVVVLKLGNTDLGRSATLAHSSRVAGTGRVYEAVFETDGIIGVPSLESLVHVSMVLESGRRPLRPGVVATSTSGAGGIVLADSLTRAGVELVRLGKSTREAMAATAGFAQVMNPFDVGAGGIDNIGANIRALADDPGTGILVCYVTILQNARNRLAVAYALRDVAADRSLPVLVVAPGPLEEDEAAVYREAGIPMICSLADATAVTAALARSARTTPAGSTTAVPVASTTAQPPELPADLTGPLSEGESKRVLAEAGVVFAREERATSVEAALEAASRIGYPVVLKPSVAGLAHKSETRLVALDVGSPGELADEMRRLESAVLADHPPEHYEGMLVAEYLADGVEVLLGMTWDPEFGPIIACGPGGVLAELVDDIALAPAPVDQAAAHALVGRTRLAVLLDGYRGGPALDVDALLKQIVALGRVATAWGERVAAIDLNPVLVRPRGAAALDALVVAQGGGHMNTSARVGVHPGGSRW